MLRVETHDIIENSLPVGKNFVFYDKKNKIVREEYYILESITEYDKTGQKEKQTKFDRVGKVSHVVRYAPDGSINNVLNLANGKP